MLNPDLERLRREYARRGRQPPGRYSPFDPANLFAIQQRQRAVLKMLARCGRTHLEELSILELGCGSGGVLAEFVALGADPRRMAGIDLLPDRLAEARARLAGVRLCCADGQRLPFAGATVDLALQFTAFSSVLDDGVKGQMAGDLLRVLKPGGLVLWYDFWLNPTNRQTAGIGPAEVRRLFPNCRIDFRRVTLAPPLARRIAPVAWGLALWLESLRIFNSHWLAAIQPNLSPDA